jgi:hypothetical protein
MPRFLSSLRKPFGARDDSHRREDAFLRELGSEVPLDGQRDFTENPVEMTNEPLLRRPSLCRRFNFRFRIPLAVVDTPGYSSRALTFTSETSAIPLPQLQLSHPFSPTLPPLQSCHSHHLISKMLNPHSPNVYISTNFAKNNAIQTANSRLYDHLPKTYPPYPHLIKSPL